MENEPTSRESYDMTIDEVLKTIPKIAPWGDMNEGLKIEEVTPMSMVECIFQLNKELIETIVKKKIKK